jgi:acyl carrier protein
MLTHANLLHNSSAIRQCFSAGDDSRGVIWLPPYHDMGLIGGVLQPLYGGFPVVLMSPLAFLARPLRWLQAITRHRGTISGGPNFAYDLCVRKIGPAERATLDLGSWQLAFNGAEPIHPDTLDRFVTAFGPCGFRREAFYPCYGLAEGTLISSGGQHGRTPTVLSVAKEALGGGQAIAPRADEAAQPLVSCGASIAGQELIVVDPERHVPVAAGRVGEIWLRGPSVARGYWQRGEETAASFQARRADTDEGSYLRTGDLGFIVDGELYVTGRIKDLVIVRGRNLYPQDIERTAVACHAALRPGCAAAFAVAAAGEEHLVIVLEADARVSFAAPALVEAIRRAVAEEHEVQAHAIVLVGPGGVPKTSSGKVQRRACRAQYLAGELTPIAKSVLAEGVAPIELVVPSRAELLALSERRRAEALVAPLRAWVATLLGAPVAAIDVERPLTAYGFDSIRSVELTARLQEDLAVELSMALVLDGASVASLAARAAAALTDAALPALPAAGDGARADAPLSLEQERLLFLEKLAPDSSAYNIATAVFLDGVLDREALRRCLMTIVARHAVLRARYPRRDQRRLQIILAPDDAALDIPLVAEALPEGLAGDRDAAALHLAQAEARRPFALDRDAVLRVRLWRVGPERHLMTLVLHHIAGDGWSMGLLVRELSTLYSALVAQQAPRLPPLPCQYADLAARQRVALDGEAYARDLAYWKQRLAEAPPLLQLPADRPRPPVRRFSGARQPFALAAAPTDGLKRLAASEGATLYMVLLAGFAALLRQRSGREDLIVGTDVAGREQPEAQRLIGLFVKQLVLRLDGSGDPSFRGLVGRVRAAALEAYAHQRVPFEKLVEALRPPRDPSYNPLFQVMFVLESAPLPELVLPGLRLQRIDLDDGGAPFDLSLLLSESGGGLGGVLRYDTDLFDAPTIAALGADYSALLSAAAAHPDATLSALTTTVEAERSWRDQAAAETLRAQRRDRFAGLHKS